MFGRRKCDPINGCGKTYRLDEKECPKCGTHSDFSVFVPINPLDWDYDLETYPNVFTAAFLHPNSGTRLLFEISERRNDIVELLKFLGALRDTGCRMVGFNNLGFDYPVFHFIMTAPSLPTLDDIYWKAASIIATSWERRFDNVIYDDDVIIPQIDLMKLHHFDNANRRTSLKMLEFNMRMDNIKDLPYKPGVSLSQDQIPPLIHYNHHDVTATAKFHNESIELIEFREELSTRYGKNFLNHNDTKIGKDYFIMELERLIPGSCYTRVNRKRVPRQTHRASIRLADVIFPYITFEQPEFNRVLTWLKSQTIRETKGVFTDLSATVEGFQYDFGTGGIHGTIDSAIVHSDDDAVIYDWDVASYYPNLAISNSMYPEHLGIEFCSIYKDVFEQRRTYAKGTPENAMLKLALNGVYGDSNNKYSPFYDPAYTMGITLNGQLLLCLLAEHLIKIPGLSMIQINTDGLTVKCPRTHVDTMEQICKWWEQFTCLVLEKAVYSTMFIRDVNNYIAVYESGDVKRKGAYEYKQQWHQDHSSPIIAMAAEAVLVYGEDLSTFIHCHTNIHDFMLRAKVGKPDQLILTDPLTGHAEELQKVTRYYVAQTGGSLTKVSPPIQGAKEGQWKRATKLTDSYYNSVLDELRSTDYSSHGIELDSIGLPWDERINTKNRSLYKIRIEAINKGYFVKPCNDMIDASWDDINFNYYIDEAKKLIDVLRA